MGCTSDKMATPTLSDAEKQTIKQSWSEFTSKGELADIGLPMFIKLFENHSELKALYSFMSDEVEQDDTKLRAHAKGVMEVVDLAVSGIDDVASLHPVLVDLGVRHHRYGVKKSHLKPVGECLLYALEKQLRDSFTKNIRSSWTTFFSVISVGFSHGLQQGQSILKSEKTSRGE